MRNDAGENDAGEQDEGIVDSPEAVSAATVLARLNPLCSGGPNDPHMLHQFEQHYSEDGHVPDPVVEEEVVQEAVVEEETVPDPEAVVEDNNGHVDAPDEIVDSPIIPHIHLLNDFENDHDHDQDEDPPVNELDLEYQARAANRASIYQGDPPIVDEPNAVYRFTLPPIEEAYDTSPYLKVMRFGGNIIHCSTFMHGGMTYIAEADICALVRNIFCTCDFDFDDEDF